MPFYEINSLLKTSLCNFVIKCQYNYESFERHVFGTKFGGGHIFLLPMGGFYNKREYSSTDWLNPLIPYKIQDIFHFGCLFVSLFFSLFILS